MSLRDAIAYDASRVFCNPEEFGEEAEFNAGGLSSGPVRITNTLWGAEERDSERHGIVGHWRTVGVAAADVVDLGDAMDVRGRDRASWTQNPDDMENYAANTWQIATAKLADGLWQFECYKLGRPVGRVTTAGADRGVVR